MFSYNNVLITYMVSGPSLLIESTDSMIVCLNYNSLQRKPFPFQNVDSVNSICFPWSRKTIGPTYGVSSFSQERKNLVSSLYTHRPFIWNVDMNHLCTNLHDFVVSHEFSLTLTLSRSHQQFTRFAPQQVSVVLPITPCACAVGKGRQFCRRNHP